MAIEFIVKENTQLTAYENALLIAAAFANQMADMSNTKEVREFWLMYAQYKIDMLVSIRRHSKQL